MASLKTRKVSSQILSLTLELIWVSSSAGLLIRFVHPLPPSLSSLSFTHPYSHALALALTRTRTHRHEFTFTLFQDAFASIFYDFFSSATQTSFLFCLPRPRQKNNNFPIFPDFWSKTIFNPIALNVYFWCNVKAQQLLQILALA